MLRRVHRVFTCSEVEHADFICRIATDAPCSWFLGPDELRKLFGALHQMKTPLPGRMPLLRQKIVVRQVFVKLSLPGLQTSRRGSCTRAETSMRPTWSVGRLLV